MCVAFCRTELHMPNAGPQFSLRRSTSAPTAYQALLLLPRPLSREVSSPCVGQQYHYLVITIIIIHSSLSISRISRPFYVSASFAVSRYYLRTDCDSAAVSAVASSVLFLYRMTGRPTFILSICWQVPTLAGQAEHCGTNAEAPMVGGNTALQLCR